MEMVEPSPSEVNCLVPPSLWSLGAPMARGSENVGQAHTAAPLHHLPRCRGLLMDAAWQFQGSS